MRKLSRSLVNKHEKQRKHTRQGWQYKRQIPSISFPLPAILPHYSFPCRTCKTLADEQYPGFCLWFQPPSLLAFAEFFMDETRNNYTSNLSSTRAKVYRKGTVSHLAQSPVETK